MPQPPEYVKHVLRPDAYDPENGKRVPGGRAWCGDAVAMDFYFLGLDHVAGEELRQGRLLACPVCLSVAMTTLRGRKYDKEAPEGLDRVYEICRQISNDCSFRSDVATDHPLYKELVGMGERAVPALLFLLAHNERPWDGVAIWEPISALFEITGVEDLIPEEDAGRLPRVIQHWLKWGHEQGIEWVG
jgi:hypothetical protein